MRTTTKRDVADRELVDSITPILTKLNSRWFPPNKKSAQGYFYSCSYCDMECGGTANHDKDCILQTAKNTLEKFEIIENDQAIVYNFKNEKRSPAEILNIKYAHKAYAVVELMFTPLMSRLVPWDNGGFCECIPLDQLGTNEDSGYHAPDCPYMAVSQLLSNYYSTK